MSREKSVPVGADVDELSVQFFISYVNAVLTKAKYLGVKER